MKVFLVVNDWFSCDEVSPFMIPRSSFTNFTMLIIKPSNFTTLRHSSTLNNPARLVRLFLFNFRITRDEVHPGDYGDSGNQTNLKMESDQDPEPKGLISSLLDQYSLPWIHGEHHPSLWVCSMNDEEIAVLDVDRTSTTTRGGGKYRPVVVHSDYNYTIRPLVDCVRLKEDNAVHFIYNGGCGKDEGEGVKI